MKYAVEFSRVCSQLTDLEADDADPVTISINTIPTISDTEFFDRNNLFSASDRVDDIRATFAFDKILYRDAVLEVNPGGVYFVRSKKWLDIMDVTGISVKLRVKTPLLKPTMLQRMSLRPSVRARTPPSVVVHNVSFEIHGFRTVGIHAERPLEVKEAVDHARNTVY